MQLISHKYETADKLDIFLDQMLSHKGAVFIQLFSGVMDKTLIQSLLDIIDLKLPDALLIGATTAGEIIDGVMTSGEIIVSVSLFDSTTIQTYYYPRSDYSNGVRIAQEILSDRTKVCIALSEGLKSDSESFLDGFTSIRNDVVVAGGNAGDDLTFTRTYIMKENIIYDEGVVIAVLDSDLLQVHNAYSLNWTSIGKEMTITKVDKNIVYEIDNRPVMELYKHYLGTEIFNRGPISTIEFPLIKINDGVRIARDIIAKTEEDAFIYAGHFNTGEKVRFAIGNVDEILDHAADIRDTVASSPVEATYIYSCSARKLFFSDQLNYEFGLINDIAPTAGFFTYGEFFHSNSGNQLLNITTTTLSLNENRVTVTDSIKKRDTVEHHHTMLKSLTHLVNVTQHELDESIRELVAKEYTIKRQLVDPLSGLKNRTALLGDLESAEEEITLILLNIDRFSTINDYFGYEIGDELLKAFGKRLESISDHNYLYRISGDEFALICNTRTFDETLRDYVIEQINKLENFKYSISGHEISVNISAGIAHATYTDVYNLAHMALKEAKEQRDKLIIFNDDTALSEKTRNNIWIFDQIKSAIEEDRIVPYFQGIVDNETRRIVKYESLIRLIEPDGKVLTPFWFLEHAKKTKLYDKLTRIMIAKTFDVFEKLEYEFSLNLTVNDIILDETRSYIYEILENSVASNRVVFEIVESEGIVNYEEVINFIRYVKQFGCKIAIDDFGSGYSNFSYLSKLDVDYIKIDGSLIKKINSDEDHLLTVESILFFAQKKGIKTIAEYVEDESIFVKVLDLGIDYSQGYLFSTPQPTIQT
jgi:diguanylate cyclase (GGDEF)-like protein